MIDTCAIAVDSKPADPSTMNGTTMITTARRSLLTLTTLAMCSMLAPLAAQAQTSAAKHKVVFQVSDADPQKWNLTLNNAKNVADELGEDAVEMEIVVYGPAIGMLKADSAVGKRVADALKSGTKVVACENTMKTQKLVYADMLPNIGYAPAGVVELMKKQREGFAYIRP